MAHALTWLDVFTSRPLTGNGLAVVHDADGLDAAAMLGFARETKLSETTFVQTAGDPGADYRNRIWMTTGELRFAGHPSLGTAVAVARARGEREARYVQQTGAGLQPIDVEIGGRVDRASMLQEPAAFGEEVEPARALGALGLSDADAHPELPPQVVGTGIDHLMVPLGDAAALDRARPDATALRELLATAGCVCAYLTVPDPDRERAAARSFFVDAAGAVEDPATGSAAGPLAVHLARHGRIAFGDEIEISQGAEIGRPSTLFARVDGSAEQVEKVEVGGSAVPVARGEFRLPVKRL
jgi:trans-2,3-dihydro-3-hydroxyanthranilate isomerase